MNKTWSVILLIVLIILLILVSTFFGFLMVNGGKFPFNLQIGGYSDKLIESKTVETANKIKVDVNTADVFVEHSTDDKISVELYSDYDVDHEISYKDEELFIKLQQKPFVGFGIRKQNKVVVKVPESYDKEFNILTTTGDITMDSYEKANADIEVRTGDIIVKDLNELKVTDKTGDIQANHVKVADLKTTTGDVEVISVDTIKVKITTGDTKIDTVNNNFDIEGDTGGVRITTANLLADSSISVKTGDVRINTLTGAFIEADSKTGDIKVTNNDRKLDLTCKIHTTTGDIKVNQ